MEKIEHTALYGRKDVFELVKAMPDGYEIWNIKPIPGYENYLPICMTVPGTAIVRLDTLKAVKMDEKEMKFLMRFSMRAGCNSRRETEKYLNRKNIKPENRAAAEKALAIFNKIMA